MIPKTIHYCWFGHNPKPKLALKCMKSWKKHCPDYEIIEWNEDNFDISSCPLYVRQAYEAKKWAFVTDYVRLKVVYEHGGIYLDTDVELIKRLDKLREYNAYFGFEDGIHVNTGLGFGAVKDEPILHEMMADYSDIPFILQDGTFDLTPCPVRNTDVFTKHGLIKNNTIQSVQNCLVLPTEYLCPYDGRFGYLRVTDNSMTIHWFSGSWTSEDERKRQQKLLNDCRRKNRLDWIVHLPNRIGLRVLGAEAYEKLKQLLGRS